MRSKPTLLFISMACFSCADNSANVVKTTAPRSGNSVSVSNNSFSTIDQIPLPKDFVRVKKESQSFSDWLGKVALKRNKTVYLYNGHIKANQKAQFAVLDISVGNKDLQQCADAVMRLRAEYLFSQYKFSEIAFKDNANTVYQLSKPYSRENFNNYLNRVFGMCGSASLSKQLKSISIKDMEPGDVFIRGGFPGHAVIVMDVAVNNKGEKIYLLAQSYMPAQDIHVLVNPNDTTLSPWYLVNDDEKIYTPEYMFMHNELKRWQ